MPTPSELFGAVVAGAPSQPFVTYYNEVSGERAELSAKSLGNWVAKTHFLLQDSLGLGPGDTAQVRIRTDWLSVAVLLGCWSAGLRITPAGAGADVSFVNPEDAATAGAADVFVLNPQTLSRSFGATPPPGTEDFVSAVRPQPDAWAGVHAAATADAPAAAGLSAAALLAAAAERAQELNLGAGARMLVAVSPDEPNAAGSGDAADVRYWLDTLVLPLLLGGSVVYVAGADAATVTRRAEQERAVLLA